MELNEFIKRYNQEIKWNSELLNTDFFKTHPFIDKEFRSYLDNKPMTHTLYDYNTATIYEEEGNADEHYFECQIYSYAAYGEVYLCIHPDLDEMQYKAWKIEIVKKKVSTLIFNINSEFTKLGEQMKELSEFNSAVCYQF